MKKLIAWFKKTFTRVEVKTQMIESIHLVNQLKDSRIELSECRKHLEFAIKTLDGRCPPDHLEALHQAKKYIGSY